MTTPDQQQRSTAPMAGAERGFEPARDERAQHAPMMATPSSEPGPTHGSVPSSEHHAGTGQHPESGHHTEAGESLFRGMDLSDLRSRWDDVQAAFVDDPRECVQKADRLVSDVVEQLTAGFAQARAQLEEQWSRGQEASTEDLRQALKRYREFFQRLLSVS